MLLNRLMKTPSAVAQVLHLAWPNEIVALADYDYDALSIRVVDLRNCASKIELLDACASALEFPPYFGRNWDAFDECLADLEKPVRGTFVLGLQFSTKVTLGEDELHKLFAILRSVAAEWEQGGQRRLAIIILGDLPTVVSKAITKSGLRVVVVPPENVIREKDEGGKPDGGKPNGGKPGERGK